MDYSNNEIRVRFAPSPTGYLHVGGARTALYNWLFAKRNNGKFILRIEDTDQERHNEEAVKAILDSMKWLGLDWDEGPFYQSERLQIYKDFTKKLIDEGKAYYCYCSPEELEKERKEAEEKKLAPKYNGKCRHLSKEEIDKFEKEGRKKVVRIKSPTDGITVVKDLIRKDIKFENKLLDDFVIQKSDGFPTYNFAVVIDDYSMKITHVIRGDDHISNTPRQIIIYQAFGFEVPKFAHIPMILGKDKTKLSKRHGALSVLEYKKMGYLPQALVNYLARLGWGYGNKEIFSIEELCQLFEIEKVNKTSAVFDMEKLTWMNATYIRALPIEKLFEYCDEMLENAYPKYRELKSNNAGKQKIYKILLSIQERMHTLTDVVHLSDFFFSDVNYDASAMEKHLKQDGTKEILSKLLDKLKSIEPFSKENIEHAFRSLANDLQIKAGKIIHPARVALTGRSDSPPMFETVELLGKEITLKRLEKALEIL